MWVAYFQTKGWKNVDMGYMEKTWFSDWVWNYSKLGSSYQIDGVMVLPRMSRNNNEWAWDAQQMNEMHFELLKRISTNYKSARNVQISIFILVPILHGHIAYYPIYLWWLYVIVGYQRRFREFHTSHVSKRSAIY